jgi:sRNA-binding regulator protein Hfq
VAREVFAEEIEAFLERLETVSAARVVANDGGEIEHIYATTESTRDDGSIRRAITSALLSQYNLHIDGWRVQVAHLQPQVEPEPVPECQLVRLEETVTETMTRVVVDLRYERDGAQRTTSGNAQSPPGQAHRLRTVAVAAVDALAPLVERAGNRLALEGLMFTPFAGATVALAAVSLASERASVLRIGSETVAGSEAEAVVGAVLDAVRKPVRGFAQAPPRRTDRQRQFEGLRRQYEQMISARPGATPAPRNGEDPPAAQAGDSPAASESGTGEDAEPPDSEPSPARVAVMTAALPEASAPLEDVPSEDAIESMADIRPEREGGASLVIREEPRQEGQSAIRSAPRPSMEDAFYRRLVTSGAPVHIRCRDGYEIPAAVVKDFGTYSLLVEANGIQELVFKHGIIAVRPYGPIPQEPLPTA